MKDQRPTGPSWARWSGIGFEFAAALIGFTLVGIWIDRKYACEPWGVVVGAVMGVVGGGYNFLREALLASRTAERERLRRNDDGKGS